MENNGKIWMIIGFIIIIIGLAFTLIISNINGKQIDKLVNQCEKDGGEAIVQKEGFIITTTYKFECKK